ncbi:MAG: hypothetical protein CVU16_03670 [Betaproteobacteria bacterium HGW-Betaproteobacteria-10]|nr:MAG: hypothetical protein CVU16_03670 [Betaproteobacteria bacterium HGW-Betaproteobacteria-10]
MMREDFTLIINEYALTVGLITLSDVSSTLMGNYLVTAAEEQIIQRDVDSWLVDIDNHKIDQLLVTRVAK